MRPVDLESLASRELSQLPLPRAPQTLLPRVLAAVHQWAQRPWYSRAWLTWPVGWQIASVAALLLLAVTGAVLLPLAQTAAIDLTSGSVASVQHNLAVIGQLTEVVVTAGQVLWRTLLQPVLPYAFAIVVLMCVASAAFGAALNYLVLERAFQR